MAQVPVYEGDVKEVGIPTNRVPMEQPIEAFGGGEAVANVYSQAEQLAKAGRDAADKSALTEADRRATELEISILYGSKDEQGNVVGGALTKSGRDAFEQPKKVQEEYFKGIQKINENLNSRQQVMFQSVANERAGSIEKQIMRHAANEKSKYEAEQMELSVVTKTDYAMLHALDPDPNARDTAIGSAINDASIVVAAYGRQTGKDAEWIKANVNKVKSNIHQQVIQRMLDNDKTMDAKRYYEANKDQVIGKDQGEIEKKMKLSSDKWEGMNLADDLFVKGVSQSQAEASFREFGQKFGPEARDYAESQYYDLKRKREAAITENTRQLLVKAGNYKSYNEIPNSIISKLTPSEKKGIQEYFQSLATGSYIKTNPSTKTELVAMMSSLDPAVQTKFANLNLYDPKYRNNLDNKDIEDFSAAQTGILTGDPKFADKIEGIRLTSKMVEDSIPKSIKKNREKSDAYRIGVEQALRQAQMQAAEEKKVLTQDEKRQIINQFSIQTVVDDGFLFDTKKYLHEMTGKDIDEINFVPEDMKLMIQKEFYDQFKRLPNKDESLQMWKDYLHSLKPGI